MGTAGTCMFRLVDPSGLMSCEHARLERRRTGWIVRDLESKNGVRLDGARRPELLLEPGVELGIGGLTMLAESHRFIELRSFLARLLGWTSDKLSVVDFALRAVRMAATRRVPLVLCGAGDLTQVAQAIHRHALGADRPFVPAEQLLDAIEVGPRAACARDPAAGDLGRRIPAECRLRARLALHRGRGGLYRRRVAGGARDRARDGQRRGQRALAWRREVADRRAASSRRPGALSSRVVHRRLRERGSAARYRALPCLDRLATLAPRPRRSSIVFSWPAPGFPRENHRDVS
jgi:FHA domain